VKILPVTRFRCPEVAILTIKTCTGTHLLSEKSYLKPPRTCVIAQIFPASNEVWTLEKKSTIDREGSWYRNCDAASGTIFRISKRFKETTSNLIYIFILNKAG
jgi:hypothetical protein